MMDLIAYGTCDGTGAAIHVCLGWKPRKVRVLNMEDGGALSPEMVWNEQQRFVSGMDEGILLTDTVARAEVTSNGISLYEGGDTIVYDGVTYNRWEAVVGAASVEEVYVNGHYLKAASGDAAYQCIGNVICPAPTQGAKVITPAGFTIGTNTDLNVDGEQLTWEAYR